ncbi:S1C family serine protease [Paenibacillus thermotolerans]|uniref:S1C family serine protease n=1 Tax=Paenibacillus thermotolerans TaxID=3027807 RepID=UPI00236769C9|nr:MULTISPECIES: trypsin-like peptidase domain-containing protein [unclassified Paenibacillus]
MGLFDDDFYSPKLSRRSKRKLSSSNWPTWRRPGRYTGIAAASAAGGALAIFLILSPWLFGGAGGGVRTDERSPDVAYEDVASQPDRVVHIVEELKPAIVSVISSHEGEEGTAPEVSLGSGIVYEIDGKRGKIVTNHHVIEDASSIEVVLSDGQRMDAKLIGSDVLTDLAVLEVDGRKLPSVAEFGDSSKLREGESVIAIGHPFGLGYSPTFTGGMISSLNRIIPISLAMDGNIDWEMELLQTDAAINHGNSGGALVGMDGKVIGVNTMKVAQPGVEGLGFAIPSNLVVSIIEELEQYGKVRRPYMGVATVDLELYRGDGEDGNMLKLPDEVEDGIIVLEAYGPAKDAGLTTNDVIVSLDDKPIGSTLDLRKFLYDRKKIGDNVKVDYYRDGKKYDVDVQLTENPDP